MPDETDPDRHRDLRRTALLLRTRGQVLVQSVTICPYLLSAALSSVNGPPDLHRLFSLLGLAMMVSTALSVAVQAVTYAILVFQHRDPSPILTAPLLGASAVAAVAGYAEWRAHWWTAVGLQSLAAGMLLLYWRHLATVKPPPRPHPISPDVTDRVHHLVFTVALVNLAIWAGFAFAGLRGAVSWPVAVVGAVLGGSVMALAMGLIFALRLKRLRDRDNPP